MGNDLARRLAVARGDEPADVVLAGGRVLSVFTGELLETDVAIAGGHVAAVGPGYDGLERVDVSDLILLPGFVEGHMHLESTKLMIDQFARAALPWGTTTVVLDPHEIANVFGVDGVRAMLRSADEVPLDVFVMMSSCVPASPFESNGATVTAEDIAAFLEQEPNAIGLAEMMDYPAVVAGDDDALAKLGAVGGRHVDGHAPGLSGRGLNAYLAAGVMSDHECTTYAEALEKRRLGMWIMIREGSAARNLEAILPMVLEHGPTNCLLCTDDLEPDHLLERGHINDVIRRAVELGCPPSDAVVMGRSTPHGTTGSPGAGRSPAATWPTSSPCPTSSRSGRPRSGRTGDGSPRAKRRSRSRLPTCPTGCEAACGSGSSPRRTSRSSGAAAFG